MPERESKRASQYDARAVDPIDRHVGDQLRSRRLLIGLSQDELASYVGVTFQQIQKYERGANRISAGRLYRFATALEVPIIYFFEGIDDRGQTYYTPGQEEPEQEDVFSRKETFELLKCYYELEDENLRQIASDLIKSLVAN